MADENSGTNNSNQDVSAPGSKRFSLPRFAQKLAAGAIAGIAAGDKVGAKNVSSDPILEAILSMSSKGKQPRSYTQTSAARGKSSSSSSSNPPEDVGKTFNPRFRKAIVPHVSTGNADVDAGVTRALAETVGVINDFEKQTASYFRRVGRRLVALETGSPALVKRIDKIQSNQKTLADQIGYILKELDDKSKQTKNTKIDDLDKQLAALRERASKMKRDERGRFVKSTSSGGSLLQDAGEAWLGMKGLRLAGKAAGKAGGVVADVAKGAAGLVANPVVVGGAVLAAGAVGTGVALQSVNKKLAQDNMMMDLDGNLSVLEDPGKDKPKPVQPEKNQKGFWASIFGEDKKSTPPATDKNPEQAQEYKLSPYNMTFDVGKNINMKAFKDFHIKGQRIIIEADELNFNVNRISGITGANVIGNGSVRNFRRNVPTPSGEREEPPFSTFGTAPGQIGAESIGPTGATPLNLGGIKSLYSGASGGFNGPTPNIPKATNVPNNQLLNRYKAGTERLIHRAGHLKGTDPTLLNVLRTATRDLPAGYRAEIISAHDGRASGTQNHPHGIAVDLQIYDDKGRRVPNLKGTWGYGIYEKMYQSAYVRAKDMYPKEKLLWGGGFVHGVADDKMHYQWQKNIPGTSQGMLAYDPLRGINPEYKSSFDPDNESMTGKQIKEYQDSIRQKIAQEKTGETPQIALTPNQKNPDNGSVVLANQRAAFADQIKKNPQLRHMAMAMMLSEEGGDDKARRALLESAMNRASAHGINSISKILGDTRYYQPYQNGAYARNLQRVLHDPKLREQLQRDIDAVEHGSDVSGLATQNGSASVGAHARQTQSVGYIADNRETFSRKDRMEYARIHGLAYTKQEHNWFLRTSEEMKEAAKQQHEDVAPLKQAYDYHLIQPGAVKDEPMIKPNPKKSWFGRMIDDIGMSVAAGDGVTPDNPNKWKTYEPESKAEIDKAFGPPSSPNAKPGETKEAQSKKNYHDTRISKPRHDPEAAGPTPGSDGYGSGACDPDGGGICSV